jgi:predicted O-linked N-acetylglucosamine transferase (SPINDLY family)
VISIQEAYNSALLLFQQGKLPEALRLLERLQTQYPNDATLLQLAGACYFGTGLISKAERCWQSAARQDPGSAEIHANLGMALRILGRLSEAEATLRKALALDSGSVHASNSLGAVLKDLGRHDEAEKAFRQTLAIDPNFAEANNSLGALLLDLGRPAEAEVAFRRALASQPDYAQASYNLGLVLYARHQLSEAESAFRWALSIDSHFAEANNNLGLVHYQLDHMREAEEAFGRALDSRPDLAQAHVNLAHVLHRTGRLDEAEAAAQHALQLGPKYADAYYVLGKALGAKNAGDIGRALKAFRRAIELDPDCLPAHSNFLHTLTFHSDDGYQILDACKQFASHFEAHHLSRDVRHVNDRSPGRRLRVGYVSPDFRSHCQALFMLPLLRNHDHHAFEIFCYSSVRNMDAVSELIRNLTDIWRDVCDLDDEALAKQVIDDRIDILIDLTMHMSNGRPLLFARRPAPVQVAWLAYPGTTGSNAIDYRLTDPWLDPLGDPGADSRYSERSIRLPNTFWCYASQAENSVVSTLPADQNGWITFGCLNSPQKLNDETFRLWANVLHEVNRSCMILLVAEGDARDEVSRKFEALGIARSRLNFVGYQSREAYLQTYRRIDIALDTFPYNGHTTSLDSFWMGVPVVTKIGKTPHSRAGYSLLMNLGLPELVAGSDDEFVKVAVALADDLPRMRDLRSELRQRMERSPLMDGAKFARDMEAAYRNMWKAWCENGRPDNFTEIDSLQSR